MSGKSWKDQVAEKRAAKQDEKTSKAKANATTAVKVQTSGWRSYGNAWLFELKLNEPMVAHYLQKGGMALARTQQCVDYDFEFHPMHTTGCPVYIRMKDNDDTSLMTKFDTRNKTAPQRGKKGDFHNLGKLTLTETQLTELVLLIKENFAFLQYMAQRVYEEDGIC